MNTLIVLGIRGIPAAHGGFETFAEKLCAYLVSKGWEVIVYCQEEGEGPVFKSSWQGVTRFHVPVRGSGPLSTIFFDIKSITHSISRQGVFLTLGYNTAIFNFISRFFGKYNIINMDGVEWKRQKWGSLAKVWFWANERFGCWFGNHLIADHPCIEDHLATRVRLEKITMIPYGAVEIQGADESVLNQFGLVRDEYAVMIARPEPENSIVEIIEGFSRKKRGKKLVVLGNYDDARPYHRRAIQAASEEVIFVGGIYEVSKVSALRFFSRCYVHGHQVGGTNPSLVESIGAGNAILAHDNKFNRWVAKDGAIYFSDAGSVDRSFDLIFHDDQLVHRLKAASLKNFRANFRWEGILSEYETLLLKHYPR